MKKPDLRGKVPESWACIDCGINTAPSHLNREQMEQAFARDWADKGVENTYTELTEIYEVKRQIWEAAGMEPMNGCLCIGCLEKRLGRTLTAKDFVRNGPLNKMPGTERLLERRNVDLSAVDKLASIARRKRAS
jgi:hypothetical protein